MCGNWGLLCLAEFASQAQKRGEALPDGLERLLRQMIHVIEMRGAQAGGFNMMLPKDEFSMSSCRVRVLKPKRGDLCDTLFERFEKDVAKKSWLGALRSVMPFCFPGGSKTVLVQGHSRFGTSSPPAVRETHPHQWSPTSQVSHWAWDGSQQRWRRKDSACAVVITHNGDFDAWRPYRDTTVGLDALACWLDRVLGVHNDATGDSAKAAGVMELLVCQGVWLHSVRMAYHLFVACHVEQASGWSPMTPEAPSTVPSKAVLASWASVFEKEFNVFIQMEAELVGARHPFAPECGLVDDFVQKVEAKLREGSSGTHLKEWIPDASLGPFVTAAVEAFRDNDLLAAVTAFLRRAVGTFGFTATSTLHPQTVVVSSRGQPMSVGFGGPAGGGSPKIVAWSSEPAALTTVAKQAAELGTSIVARLDLDDQSGEVIQFSARNANIAPLDTQDGGFIVSLDAGSVPSDDEHLEAHGLHFGTPLRDEDQWAPIVMKKVDFLKRLKWLSGGDAPASPRPSAMPAVMAVHKEAVLEARDVIAQDLQQTPAIVGNIDLSWSDAASQNSLAAEGFAERLLHNLKTPSKDVNGVRHIDVLVLGVESSLWMATQFCADLTRLFPSVHAVAMSSNVVLGLLQQGPGHVNPFNWVYSAESFNITSDTIGLAVSHSGTTYPTVWATRHLCARTSHVWGLSGSFDCLLSNSIKHGLPSEEAAQPHFFSTFAGVRTAEAATLTTLAMHHTFSQLLLKCAAAATGANLPSLLTHSREAIFDGHAADIGECTPDKATARLCSVNAERVLDMQRLAMSLYWGACTICGVDHSGARLLPEQAETYHKLRRMGLRWSHHITEGYWATFVPALYVILTVTFGILPITTLVKVILEATSARSEEWLDYLWYATRAMDAAIYVFNPIIVAIIHRVCTGRRIWARFTTRTLCIVESTVNYKLLRAYASKLLALTWRFATLSVIGQNGTDHFVHEYTHKAQSDVLVAVGLPDGRLTSLASAEACTMMSLQQAKFIKPKNKGIEAYSLGHNRWARPGVFVEALKLPTNRPLFASELTLMPEQLGKDGEGIVVPGMHGLPPATIGQRWHDLIRQNLDPNGMKRVNCTLEDLRARVAPRTTIDIETGVTLLDELLRTTLNDEAVNVTLGLKAFLSRFFSQGRAAVNIYVHSPAKEYVPPVVMHSPDKEKLLHSPSKGYVATDGDKTMARMAKTFASLDGHRETSIEHTPGEAIRTRIFKKMADSDKSGTHKAAQRHATLDVLESGKEELELHEFMALLHGDELQTWVREARYRWGKLRAVRGLLAYFADDFLSRKQSASSVVMCGGVTMGRVFSAWKTLAKQGKTTRKSDAKTSRSSVVRQAVANAISARAEEDMAIVDRKTIVIGQALLDEEVGEAELLKAMKLTECFYESRVGSAERLLSWFVLLHAMAEPSSRLPFLRYDLGKSESRLRVASTPAPVPNHEDPSECNPVIEEVLSPVASKYDDDEDFEPHFFV